MEDEKKPEEQINLLDILKKISPGKVLRTGLDDIVMGRTGALIVIANPLVKDILEGGFKINSKLTAQRLMELSKMDGAVILSNDLSKILYANTLLVPDSRIPTVETGTRHKAAERTAKQTKTLVIAVSERKGTITIYQGNIKYVLISTEDILRRAIETLQILESQRGVFDELLGNLNVLEMTSLVSVSDVCSVIQRLEMINKMSSIINRYVVELGREGIIVRMRLREVIHDLKGIEEMILKDYTSKPTKFQKILSKTSFNDLLNFESISEILFGNSNEKQIIPKGYRIIKNTDLSEEEIEKVVQEFKNLDNIFSADEKRLEKVLKDKKESFKKKIQNLKEQVMIGKKI